ncbi:MAG: hypothetical protein V1792_01510 [Pseudomonadota bacterium]
MTEAARITSQSHAEVGRGQVIFIPDRKGDHCPGFGDVSLLAGGCENAGDKAVPFAYNGNFLVHGDPPLHLLTGSSQTVFGKMVIPKDTTASCAGMKLRPIAAAHPIGDEILVKASSRFLSP